MAVTSDSRPSNFFADNDGRNPYIGVAEQSVSNNIVYNWDMKALRHAAD
jgi:hypothetical protein